MAALPAKSPDSATVSQPWRQPDWLSRELTGIETIRPKWTLTRPITPALRRQAADWLREHHGYLKPASSQSIHDWLTALGLQVAGGAMSADEATLRISAYADTLNDRPGYWFTRATLKACAEHFKWFPSVAELVEHLTDMTGERDQQVNLARRIVNAPDHPAPEVAMPRTMAQRIGELAEAKRMNGLDPNKPAGSQLKAMYEPPPSKAEPAKPLYVWHYADGRSVSATERPEGALSAIEWQQRQAREAA